MNSVNILKWALQTWRRKARIKTALFYIYVSSFQAEEQWNEFSPK